jgi:hypothetical protein
MPGGDERLAAVVDLDVVPAVRVPAHGLRDERIGFGERFLGGIGEHHAEAERVVRPVALEHGHVVARVGLLDERGEEEPRRAAADARDFHCPSSLSSRPAITRCCTSLVPS